MTGRRTDRRMGAQPPRRRRPQWITSVDLLSGDVITQPARAVRRLRLRPYSETSHRPEFFRRFLARARQVFAFKKVKTSPPLLVSFGRARVSVFRAFIACVCFLRPFFVLFSTYDLPTPAERFFFLTPRQLNRKTIHQYSDVRVRPSSAAFRFPRESVGGCEPCELWWRVPPTAWNPFLLSKIAPPRYSFGHVVDSFWRHFPRFFFFLFA